MMKKKRNAIILSLVVSLSFVAGLSLWHGAAAIQNDWITDTYGNTTPATAFNLMGLPTYVNNTDDSGWPSVFNWDGNYYEWDYRGLNVSASEPQDYYTMWIDPCANITFAAFCDPAHLQLNVSIIAGGVGGEVVEWWDTPSDISGYLHTISYGGAYTHGYGMVPYGMCYPEPEQMPIIINVTRLGGDGVDDHYDLWIRIDFQNQCDDDFDMYGENNDVSAEATEVDPEFEQWPMMYWMHYQADRLIIRDPDWYRLDMTEGCKVNVTVNFTQVIQPIVEVRDEYQNPIWSYMGGPIDHLQQEEIQWTPGNGDTLYLLVEWPEQADCVHYNVSLDVFCCTDALEENDDQYNAKEVDDGWSEYPGIPYLQYYTDLKVSQDDDDWFYYQFSGDGQFTVSAEVDYTVGMANLGLEVYEFDQWYGLTPAVFSQQGFTNQWAFQTTVGPKTDSFGGFKVRVNTTEPCVPYNLTIGGCTWQWGHDVDDVVELEYTDSAGFDELHRYEIYDKNSTDIYGGGMVFETLWVQRYNKSVCTDEWEVDPDFSTAVHDPYAWYNTCMYKEVECAELHFPFIPKGMSMAEFNASVYFTLTLAGGTSTVDEEKREVHIENADLMGTLVNLTYQYGPCYRLGFFRYEDDTNAWYEYKRLGCDCCGEVASWGVSAGEAYEWHVWNSQTGSTPSNWLQRAEVHAPGFVAHPELGECMWYSVLNATIKNRTTCEQAWTLDPQVFSGQPGPNFDGVYHVGHYNACEAFLYRPTNEEFYFIPFLPRPPTGAGQLQTLNRTIQQGLFNYYAQYFASRIEGNTLSITFPYMGSNFDLNYTYDLTKGVLEKFLFANATHEEYRIERYSCPPPAPPQHPPDVPQLKPITPNPSTTGAVFLNWSVVASTDNYTVFQAASPITVVNGSVTPIATVISPNHTLSLTRSANGTYWFAIRANNASGSSQLSPSQGVVVAIPPAPGPGPQPPANNTVPTTPATNYTVPSNGTTPIAPVPTAQTGVVPPGSTAAVVGTSPGGATVSVVVNSSRPVSVTVGGWDSNPAQNPPNFQDPNAIRYFFISVNDTGAINWPVVVTISLPANLPSGLTDAQIAQQLQVMTLNEQSGQWSGETFQITVNQQAGTATVHITHLSVFALGIAPEQGGGLDIPGFSLGFTVLAMLGMVAALTYKKRR